MQTAKGETDMPGSGGVRVAVTLGALHCLDQGALPDTRTVLVTRTDTHPPTLKEGRREAEDGVRAEAESIFDYGLPAQGASQRARATPSRRA